MIKLKSYKTFEELQKAAKIARSARLFVPGWQLNWVLHDLADGERRLTAPGCATKNVKLIMLAKKANKYVGIGVVFSDGYIWIFVRKAERKKGIATAISHKSMSVLGRKRRFKFSK